MKTECGIDGTGIVVVPKDFFESACIIEAASEFTHICFFSFNVKDDKIEIHVSGKKNAVTEDLLGEFANKLIDHQAWREINKDFSHIRNQIVDQAFAPLRNDRL